MDADIALLPAPGLSRDVATCACVKTCCECEEKTSAHEHVAGGSAVVSTVSAVLCPCDDVSARAGRFVRGARSGEGCLDVRKVVRGGRLMAYCFVDVKMPVRNES